MTDMTAEQALAEYIEGTGIRRGNEWESGFLHGYVEGLHQALFAPRGLEDEGIKALEAAAEDALALSQAAFSGSQESLRMQMAYQYLIGRIDRLKEEKYA